MKKIYFVRHGQSQANIDGIGAGAEMDSPLTAEGEKQANELAAQFQGKKIDLIVSSPLVRAFRTAEIIAEKIHYDSKKIISNPLFIERGLGRYSGRPIREFGEALDKGEVDETVESVEALVSRTSKAVEWLSQQKAKEIIVVSHSDVSAALRLIHRKLPSTHLYKLEAHPNGTVYEFDVE